MHCNDSCHGAVYLALSLPPVEFPTRKTLDYWLPVALVRWPRLRHVVETGTILCISLLLALLFPSSSAKVLLVTGATGVMMASYIVPVVNQLLLYFSKARCQKKSMQPSSMPDDSAHGGDIDRNAPDPEVYSSAIEPNEIAQPDLMLQQDLEGAVSPLEPVIPNPPRRHCDPHHYRSSTSWSVAEVLKEVCLPLLVLAVGMFCSIALSTLGNH